MAASRIKTANKSQKEKREENQTFDPFHARPIFQKKKSTVHNKRNSVKLGKRENAIEIELDRKTR